MNFIFDIDGFIVNWDARSGTLFAPKITLILFT